MFDIIHQEGVPLTARNEDGSTRPSTSLSSIAKACRTKDFDAAYDSMSVAANLLRAEKLTQKLAVSTVPVMFVNGKFSTSVDDAGGTAQMLALVNDLAASEKNR